MEDVGWTNTTHDWSTTVDHEHLARIRSSADSYAPSGALHLLHEVLAYVADEVEALADTSCEVTVHTDGSIAVQDHGRGTDTRRDQAGRIVRKPVMGTQDLRFFDNAASQTLPDGHPRRGMSVVAALSDWLLHQNRRPDGAWQQRYERGVPVTDLQELPADGTTGTVVRFRPAAGLEPIDVADLPAVLCEDWPAFAIRVHDRR
jgi:topoisomerase-4 subunit B